MGERRGAYRALVGNLRDRDHLEDPSVDGRIILKWINKKWDGGITLFLISILMYLLIDNNVLAL
jgi:hypothetical protein